MKRGFSKFNPGVKSECVHCGTVLYIFPQQIGTDLRDHTPCIKCKGWTQHFVENGEVRRVKSFIVAK
jgi:hypothetical protein